MKFFLRAQSSAAIATALDFTVFLILFKVLGVYYVWATAIGATCGAICNFLINRYWAFRSSKERIELQALRYLLVSLGSLILNTWGLYMITEWSGMDPFYGKIIVSILVAWCFNYTLHRFWVFKTSTSSDS